MLVIFIYFACSFRFAISRGVKVAQILDLIFVEVGTPYVGLRVTPPTQKISSCSPRAKSPKKVSGEG